MFNFKLVTPEGIKIDQDVEMIIVRTESGDRGILENHRPLVANVKASTLRYKVNGQFSEVEIEDGFLKVNKNGTTVVTR